MKCDVQETFSDKDIRFKMVINGELVFIHHYHVYHFKIFEILKNKVWKLFWYVAIYKLQKDAKSESLCSYI